MQCSQDMASMFFFFQLCAEKHLKGCWLLDGNQELNRGNIEKGIKIEKDLVGHSF